MAQVKKYSSRQLNGTYIQEDNQQHESRLLHYGSNAFVRIKIGAMVMELWHFEGKGVHFVGDEVNTNVRGLLQYRKIQVGRMAS
jgi:hypothetical protein